LQGSDQRLGSGHPFSHLLRPSLGAGLESVSTRRARFSPRVALRGARVCGQQKTPRARRRSRGARKRYSVSLRAGQVRETGYGSWSNHRELRGSRQIRGRKISPSETSPAHGRLVTAPGQLAEITEPRRGIDASPHAFARTTDSSPLAVMGREIRKPWPRG